MPPKNGFQLTLDPELLTPLIERVIEMTIQRLEFMKERESRMPRISVLRHG